VFRIKVADIVMEYDAHHKDFFFERLKGYFYEGNEETDLTFKYEVVDRIELPKHECVRKFKDTRLCTLENGNLFMYLKHPRTGTILTCMEYSPDFSFSHAKAIHIEPNENVKLTDCDREYLKSGAAFTNRILYRGGTTLHGSCIEYKGEGVIFSAPCGTGKSTHTSLWRSTFPDDVSYINDDKPLIRVRDSGITVSGAPWSGKNYLQSNKTVPLKAIVFLERSEKNSISILDTAQAICYLADQTLTPFYSKELGLKNMETIEKIMGQIPVYKLRCNMDPEAAILARDTIFKGES